MTQYREILRLNSLGINHSMIAASVGSSRQTVISVLKKAAQKSINYAEARDLSDKDFAAMINDVGFKHILYRMPDYERIHKEFTKNGVTLSLLWVEYCEECRESGDIPYQSTQFNKYYGDYVRKTGATMHIERNPGETRSIGEVTRSVCGMNASQIKSPPTRYVIGSHMDRMKYLSRAKCAKGLCNK